MRRLKNLAERLVACLSSNFNFTSRASIPGAIDRCSGNLDDLG